VGVGIGAVFRDILLTEEALRRRLLCRIDQAHALPADAQRQRVMEIASLLEEKCTIPAMLAQLAYLASKNFACVA